MGKLSFCVALLFSSNATAGIIVSGAVGQMAIDSFNGPFAYDIPPSAIFQVVVETQQIAGVPGGYRHV